MMLNLPRSVTGLPHRSNTSLPPVLKSQSLPASYHSGPELAPKPGTKAKPILDSTPLSQESSMDAKAVPGSSGTGPVSSGRTFRSGDVDSHSKGACAFPLETEDIPFTEEHYSGTDLSGTISDSDEDLLSHSLEKTEQTEDMNYRETVRSVRSFMAWHHIPTLMIPNRISPITLGRVNIPRGPPEFLSPCHQMIGYAKN